MLKKTLILTASLSVIAYITFNSYTKAPSELQALRIEESTVESQHINEAVASEQASSISTLVQPNNVKYQESNVLDESSYNWENNTWRQPSEEFQSFITLSSKVLTTASDRQNFELLLNDYKMVEATRKALLSDISVERYNYDDERERWDAIYYISTIITGKYKTQHLTDIINLSLEVINKPLPDNIPDDEIKKSLIGDKVEIAIDLAIFQPDIWQEYKASSDPTMSKFINYVDNKADLSRNKMKSDAQKLADRLKSLSKESNLATQ